MIRGVLLGLGFLLAQSGCSGSSSNGGSGVESGAGGGGAGGAKAAAGAAGAGGKAAGGAGAGGVGGVSDDPCQCLPYEVAWWRDGGRMAMQSKLFAKPCNTFVYSESPTPRQCESSLAQGCDETFGVNVLSVALDHPDVRAAMTAARVLYGKDTRPVDGQVVHIELDGKVIEVGAQCSEPDCEIPGGIQTLQFLLDSVGAHELGTDCLLPKAP